MDIVELSRIRIDGGTQPRESIDQCTVDEYAEAMARFDDFPPLVVYFDGIEYWLADGFHRYHAAMKAGLSSMSSDVRTGTLDDAKFYASASNGVHGLKRKDVDKKRAILMLLETSKGKAWLAEKGKRGGGLKMIADHCHVSGAYVTQTVQELSVNSGHHAEPKRASVERAIDSNPDATDREVARTVGVSPTTVGAVRREIEQRPVREEEPESTGPEIAASFDSNMQRDAVDAAIRTLELAVSDWRPEVVRLIKQRIAPTLRKLEVYK